jgi:hypothetical protein
MPVNSPVLSISADCKTLNVSGGPSGATYTLFHNDFNNPTSIYELEDPTQPYNGNIDPADGEPINGYILSTPSLLNGAGSVNLTYQNIESATEESLNGVFMIVIVDPIDSSITHTLGALGHCDIDCCIANKLTDLIKCTCQEDCSTLLDTISKIYLLIHGADINIKDCIQTQDQFEKAYNKYAKAKSMCSSQECKCNC